MRSYTRLPNKEQKARYEEERLKGLREDIAIQVMNSMLSSSQEERVPEYVAKRSVILAESLIKELYNNSEKTEES